MKRHFLWGIVCIFIALQCSTYAFAQTKRSDVFYVKPWKVNPADTAIHYQKGGCHYGPPGNPNYYNPNDPDTAIIDLNYPVRDSSQTHKQTKPIPVDYAPGKVIDSSYFEKKRK